MQTGTSTQTVYVASTSTIVLSASFVFIIGACVLTGLWCSRRQTPGRLLLFFGLLFLAFGDGIPWCLMLVPRYVPIWRPIDSVPLRAVSAVLSVLGRFVSVLGLAWIVFREGPVPGNGARHEESGP